MLGAAEKKLARLGLTPMQMRVAAQRGAELHTPPSARLLPESKPKWRGPGKPKVGLRATLNAAAGGAVWRRWRPAPWVGWTGAPLRRNGSR
jgi:hypothetical protein